MKDLIEDRQSSLVVNCHILLCRPVWLMNSLLSVSYTHLPDNLVDYIDVRVEGGVLKVGFKSPRNNFSINGKHKKEVRV